MFFGECIFSYLCWFLRGKVLPLQTPTTSILVSPCSTITHSGKAIKGNDGQSCIGNSGAGVFARLCSIWVRMPIVRPSHLSQTACPPVTRMAWLRQKENRVPAGQCQLNHCTQVYAPSCDEAKDQCSFMTTEFTRPQPHRECLVVRQTGAGSAPRGGQKSGQTVGMCRSEPGEDSYELPSQSV
jgi:hypothetical protein